MVTAPLGAGASSNTSTHRRLDDMTLCDIAAAYNQVATELSG